MQRVRSLRMQGIVCRRGGSSILRDMARLRDVCVRKMRRCVAHSISREPAPQAPSTASAAASSAASASFGASDIKPPQILYVCFRPPTLAAIVILPRVIRCIPLPLPLRLPRIHLHPKQPRSRAAAQNRALTHAYAYTASARGGYGQSSKNVHNASKTPQTVSCEWVHASKNAAAHPARAQPLQRPCPRYRIRVPDKATAP